jgi:hypothetical protein
VLRGRAWQLACVGSLVLHALLAWSLSDLGKLARLPSLDLEIVKPDTVEFGVAEGSVAKPPAPSEAPAAEPSSVGAASSTPATDGDRPAPDLKKANETAKRAAPRNLPRNSFPEAGEAGRLAPRGAQLALRLDLERIAATALGDEVGALLTGLPDVHALLEGSGVLPMRDLSRLFVASPDLRREHVVLAGRHRGDESLPREAVRRLAATRGEQAHWRNQRGIAVAPWLNRDSTARVVALLGDNDFAIAREQDLPRVLSVASAQATASPQPGVRSQAWIQMGPRELLNATADHARSFVRGAALTQVPEQLIVTIREGRGSAHALELTIRARYPDVSQAKAAYAYWAALRDRYAQHPLLALMGIAWPLQNAQLSQRTEQLSLELPMSVSEARMLLRLVRDSLPRSYGSASSPTSPSRTSRTP